MKPGDPKIRKKTKKKATRLSRFASAFAGATMLFFTGTSTAVLVKAYLDAEKAFNEQARNPFVQIDRVIAALEKNEVDEMPLYVIARDAHIRERGYTRSYAVDPEGASNVITRIKWDLRVLGYYDGASNNKFTADLDEALNDFRRDFKIAPPPGGIDNGTLRALGEASYKQHMMIGLHAWKTAIREDIELEDMLRLIALEASFNPHASAKTSSAQGLGQFLKWTWMEVIRDNGAGFGLANEAAQAKAIIAAREKGLSETQKDQLEKIAALRRDYRIVIPMIARYAKKSLRGKPFSVEAAYPIYVLGPNGVPTSEKFPDLLAKDMMPGVAAANRRFYFAWEPVKDAKGVIKRDKKGFAVMAWGTPYTLAEGLQNIRNRTVEPALLDETRRTAGIVRNLSFNLQPQNWTMPPRGAGMTSQIQLK